MMDDRKPLTGARYYDAGANPGTEANPAQLPGVPLRDLTAEEFESLPLWLQHSVDASPLYRKTKPRAASSAEGAPSGE